ncbi:peptidylglycine monooxygenase-like protein [Maricurvus nonylphenolicus]|uniref:hypothetical protein n=1 Tax=Maricurvus nonylphenolicus TaxID=1008307 RepID=UPI0036F1F8B3
MKRALLLMGYDVLESIAVLSSRMDSALRNPKKKSQKCAPLLGHNGYQYRLDEAWGEPENNAEYPVRDCHEMVIDSLGRIILLTNHEKNNILIYSPNGEIVDSWTLGFKSAHGLTLATENNQDYLYICDYRTESVVKTDLRGKVLLRFPTPAELGIYANPVKYLPTGTAITRNGDVYVADGYGSSFVIQYDRKGNYIRHFGGRGKQEGSINSAHGIAIDNRKGQETVLVSSREDACFKRYRLDGTYLSAIPLPGAYVCRPVIHGDNIYAGVCWSGKLFKPNSGFVTILGADDRVISNPGGNQPVYKNGNLQPIVQDGSVFKHCHDVCVDNEGNIYVCQWNAAGAYPVKLEKSS